MNETLTFLRGLLGVLFRTLVSMPQRSEYLLVIMLVLLLVGWQYKRLAALEQKVYGDVRRSAGRRTLEAALIGLVGGVFGSIAFLLVGVSLTEIGAAYLWLVAVFLMLFSPRFLCFSYAGGIIGVSSLLFGFPQVHVPSIAALVAILHLVESLLISIDGDRQAVAVYVPRKDERGVQGGFALARFWPLPVVALVMASAPAGVAGEGLATPDWWPLLRLAAEEVPEGYQRFYMAFPFLAGLGYSDLAIGTTPRQRARNTACFLCGYSITLLALGLLADRWAFLALLTAIFMPLGHEAVIRITQSLERRRPPLYSGRSDGVYVLDVKPGSTADSCGLRPGDVVVAANGVRISRPEDMYRIISSWPVGVELLAARDDPRAGKQIVRLIASGAQGDFGILTVPPYPGTYGGAVVGRRIGVLTGVGSRLVRRLHRWCALLRARGGDC